MSRIVKCDCVLVHHVGIDLRRSRLWATYEIQGVLKAIPRARLGKLGKVHVPQWSPQNRKDALTVSRLYEYSKPTVDCSVDERYYESPIISLTATANCIHTFMPFTSKACCQRVQPVSGPSEYVWISDNLLTCLLHRFTISKSSRRNGSSVPGPLEAQKRQSKRRMMNMANTGSGAAIDVGLLMGHERKAPQHNWTWQSPGVPHLKPIQPSRKNSE